MLHLLIMKKLQVLLIFILISLIITAQDSTNYFDKYKISNEKEWKQKRLAYYQNLNNSYSGSQHDNYSLGLSNMEIGFYDTAIIYFRKSIDTTSIQSSVYQTIQDAPAYYPLMMIGSCKSALDQNDSAVFYFKKSTEFYPSNIDSYLHLAVQFIENRNYEDALVTCNRCIEVNGPSSNVSYIIALAHYSFQKEKLAIKELKSILNNNSKNLSANLLLGDIYYHLSRKAKASEYYSKVIELNPNIPEVYLRRGLLKMRSFNHEGGEILDFKSGYLLDSTDYRFPMLLGYSYLTKRNSRDLTISYFSESIEILKKDEVNYYTGSFKELELDDIILCLNSDTKNEAILNAGYKLIRMAKYYNPYDDYTSILRIIKKYPDNLLVERIYNYYLFLFKGYSLPMERTNNLIKKDSTLVFIKVFNSDLKNRHGKTEEAIQQLSSVIDSIPNYTDAINSRGTYYGKIAKYNKALNDFETVLKLKPTHLLAKYNRGNTYFKMEMFSQALFDYKYLDQYIPDNELILYSIGKCFIGLEQTDSALIFLNRVIKLDAKYCDAYYSRAQISFNGGKYEEAHQDLNKCISYCDNNYDYYMLRAKTRTELKLTEKAIFDLKVAVSIEPNKSQAYFDLGSIYLSRGKYKKSKNYFYKAVHNKENYFEAKYNVAFVTFMDKDFEVAKKLYIMYAEQNIEFNNTINQKAFDDLKSVIDDKINSKEAVDILLALQEVLNEKGSN